MFVSARPVDRPPRGLGRTPGGCLIVVPGELPGRRAVLEVAGCQGYVGGRTGGAAAVAAVGGARVSAAARRTGRTRPGGGRADARGARRRARWRSSPSAASPRCSGCRCSSPPRAQRAGYAVLAAGAAICGLLLAGAAARRGRAPRPRSLVAIGAFALALLGGGVADELLLPGRWGELAAGIGRGLSALPGARVPYRGLDEWTRLVLCLGGTVLAVLAALAAFWPRRRELGLRHVALVLLVTLYAVPPSRSTSPRSSSRGALLALLVRRLPAPRAAADHRRRRGRAASPSR